jgi:hypothetical protein
MKSRDDALVLIRLLGHCSTEQGSTGGQPVANAILSRLQNAMDAPPGEQVYTWRLLTVKSNKKG